MADDWQPGTIYMRHSDGNSSYIEEHQCWNTGRFIKAQNEACVEANQKKTGSRRSVSIVTRTEYLAGRFKGRRI